MPSRPKVAYVVPRYGTEIRGGAETGARMFAQHLVAERDYEVEIFTTCALDALTWRDELAPGTEVLHGVTVHRVASEAGRGEGFHPLSAQLLSDPGRASATDMERWVDLQGPLSPALLDAVVSSDADVVVFYPYLYYPTIRGLPLVRERAVMHPAAHEEPALHLPLFRPLFDQCRAFVFQTQSERQLVLDLFDVAATPQVLVGLGVEEAEGTPAEARSVLGLHDRPFLLYVGRVDDKKGTGILWRYFKAYKERHPGPLALVLVGQVVDPPEDSEDIFVAGMCDDSTKWGLLCAAEALVAPSPFEAFSITVVEAMTAGAPVIVNAVCGATREHCERSGAGMWFEGYAEFESVVGRMTGDAVLHRTMQCNGLAYVEANYRWPVILDRYCAFIESFAAGTTAQPQTNGVP